MGFVDDPSLVEARFLILSGDAIGGDGRVTVQMLEVRHRSFGGVEAAIL